MPNLIGTNRNGAGRKWARAGFTGNVTALPPDENYKIGSQSLPGGSSQPCSLGITIGP